MRDLVQQDDGGWLQDPVLLDRLVVEKLTSEAEALRGEGWKWIEVAAEFPYGHTSGLRRLAGETASLSDEEQARYDRSEEHTSELQSLMRISYDVFCLKKKMNNKGTAKRQIIHVTKTTTYTMIEKDQQ